MKELGINPKDYTYSHSDESSTTLKFCKKCQKTKPLTEFNRRSDRPNSYRSHCKKCCSKDNCDRSAKKRGPKKPKLTAEQRRESNRLASAKYNAQPSRKAKQAGYEAKRRAKKLKATPEWLTEYQWEAINIHYEVARSMSTTTDQEFEVDHIVPLKGKLVSGLHVPWNLQIMSAEGNRKKTNKLDYKP